MQDFDTVLMDVMSSGIRTKPNVLYVAFNGTVASAPVPGRVQAGEGQMRSHTWIQILHTRRKYRQG